MNTTDEFEYDLVTIGSGSGGVRASRVSAAMYGAKVYTSTYIFIRPYLFRSPTHVLLPHTTHLLTPPNR